MNRLGKVMYEGTPAFECNSEKAKCQHKCIKSHLDLFGFFLPCYKTPGFKYGDTIKETKAPI